MSKNHEQEEAAILSRREMLVAAGALATVAAAGPAFAKAEHDHSKHAPQLPALFEALEDCTSKGRLCISHCLASFAEGDSSLAACAAKVHEMDAICDAMSTLVAANSSYVSDMAKTCLKACEDCAAECEKHADMHRECRACMEACEAVVPHLKKLAA